MSIDSASPGKENVKALLDIADQIGEQSIEESRPVTDKDSEDPTTMQGKKSAMDFLSETVTADVAVGIQTSERPPIEMSGADESNTSDIVPRGADASKLGGRTAVVCNAG